MNNIIYYADRDAEDDEDDADDDYQEKREPVNPVSFLLQKKEEQYITIFLLQAHLRSILNIVWLL